MITMNIRILFAVTGAFVLAGWCHAQVPTELEPDIRIEQPGVRLTLVAEHPDVVTPTGIDVDSAGNVWAVSSHTHFRPEEYEGPEHDEVVVYAADPSSGDGDDRRPKRTVFYNATTATMDLELGRNFESDGWVYLAERDRILRVRDSDGDGRADQEQDLAILESEADYPHNGLSGLAWHPDGDLVFALGENFAKSWTLTAVDGSQVTGRGEGGIFRCRADGSSLRRIASGFWNPFGVCVRADGTMFAAENDPGARPPCRLLHVVEGGDYGYQRAYGNAPIHPFVCWNGELRGTLPMLHGLGEAPCGIAELGNGLIVPSWTEHRIDYYPLATAGASFRTERITLVEGGRHFRPTCIAQPSANEFYLTDWVYGSYQLHGRGRIWKLEIDPAAAAWIGETDVPPASDAAKTAGKLRTGDKSFSNQQLFQLARDQDPFLRLAAIDGLSTRVDSFDEADVKKLTIEDQISLLLAIRKADPNNKAWVRHFLANDDQQIRFETLRWIADAQLEQFLPEVEAMLGDSQIGYSIYEAALATWNALSGNPQLGVADAAMLISRVADEQASPRTRAFALRLLDPSHKRFTPQLWKQLEETGDPLLRSELVRALGSVGKPQAKELLLRIAEDPNADLTTRGDALAGLAGGNNKTIQALLRFAESKERTLREEALRSLRFTPLDDDQRQRLKQVAKSYPYSADLAEAAIDPESIKRGRPALTDTEAWQQRLSAVAQSPDAGAARRIFHHTNVGTCSKCHRQAGRGGVVGPDLSAASNLGDPNRLLRALLEPSREIDPQYYPRMLVTADGQVFTGIFLRDGGGGREFFRDNTGREQVFNTEDIVQRKELSKSMMPEGLVDLMTDREIRDLLLFLDQDRAGQTLITTKADERAEPFLGQWWLDFADGYGGWLSVTKGDEGLQAELMWRVGSPRPLARVAIEDGRLVMERKRKKVDQRFVASLENEVITVTFESEGQTASGKRCPPMPPRPDLSKIEFGEPIELFNGRDLTGWKLQPASAKNGWSANNGELVNETPKQDFSAYGSFGNLRTTDVFGDCQLHIEFNIGSKRNSGVYVRGLYEAQVVDRDSPMQGINGPGAVFGRIEPSKNAGLPGGEWQSYDITLVDRHITVVLNGQKVIDNQPVLGATGGALFGDVTRDGPLYLQGDHTSVRYRNIRIRKRL